MPTPVGSPVQPCPDGQSKEKAEEKKPELHWLKIQVNDDTGKPLAGVKVHVVLPDGAREEKTSDANGLIEIANLTPGNCTIDTDYDDQVLHESVLLQ